MANGDIVSVTVRADGWSADVVQSGDCTGGTYAFGLAANNVPGASTPYLTVTSEGYSSSGVLGTTVRTVYLTHIVRKAYPNQAQNDAAYSAPNTTTRVALSDYVYDDDKNAVGGSGTDPTVTIPAEWCTVGGNPNAAVTAGAVTNSSTLDYPKVIARWATVPYQRIVSSLDLEVIGFHRSGSAGDPLACVTFDATDGTHAISTQTVAAMTKSAADNLPVYAYTLAMTTFDQASTVTCNFTAYPKVGDADSICSSSANASWDATKSGPLPLLCDKSETYGVTVAYVDETSNIGCTGTPALTIGETITQATSGATAYVEAVTAGTVQVSTIAGTPNAVNDWTGGTSSVTFTPTGAPVANGADSRAAYDIANAATAAANPNATIGGAKSKIAAYNNTNHGRSSVDAGVIRLKFGRHKWAGDGNAKAGSTSWCTIENAPGVANGTAPIYADGVVTNLQIPLMKLSNVDVTGGTTNPNNTASVWMDSSRVTYPSTGTAFVSYATAVWVTNSTLTRNIQSTATSPHRLFRNNACGVVTKLNRSLECVVGNTFAPAVASGAGGYTLVDVLSSDACIVAYNRVYKTGGSVALGWSQTVAIGVAIVANVFEKTEADTGTCAALHADSSTNASNHMILWHNDFVGERCNFAYNDAANVLRTNYSIRYNHFLWVPVKSDTFATNGTYVGNWSVMNGVGWVGNLESEPGLNGVFQQDFPGLLKIRSVPPTISSPGYTDDKSATRTNADFSRTGAAGAGSGDYALTSDSNLRSLVPSGQAVIPWDLAGTAYGLTGNGSAGAYQYAADLNTATVPVGFKGLGHRVGQGWAGLVTQR